MAQSDFPWVNATVERREGFDAIAPLYEEELRLLDELADEESPEWTAAYERIRSMTRLTFPDGSDVPEYLLHIDGEHAWWRWSETAFDAT